MLRTQTMKSDILANLRQYWENLRNGRVAPYRAELDPRKFEDALEHMFILEQLNPNQLRVRLAGMSLCEMMGMEVRGMPPEAFMEASHRAAFTAHINTVLNSPAVIELELLGRGHDGQETKARMLMMPLRSDFGEVTRVLGCVVTDEKIVSSPANFSITGVKMATITESEGESRSMAAGFAEEADPYTAALPEGARLRTVETNAEVERTAPKRGHLRIVSSRD
ncbi:PAS domain-containing protein [Algicella marina]|uniref:PAS domain-containing protein n=1 Tax=Algicella marina TaxID=2683284 RepID=A0A6P1T470_9RHOB|nr:PAS domain-containing protein [Algicella marina]QHQ35332.1 PAS domain-containing protein [Algicella marina]